MSNRARDICVFICIYFLYVCFYVYIRVCDCVYICVCFYFYICVCVCVYVIVFRHFGVV